MLFLIFYFYFAKLFNLPELSENDRIVYAFYSFFEIILEIIGIIGIISIVIESKRK